MKPSVAFSITVFTTLILASTTCRAQQASPADLQKQIDALKAQVGTLQKDLDEIKALLAPLRNAVQPPTPQNLTLTLGTRPVKGAAAARLVLVEFTDYQ
jgi:protein-disulfide isomerase